MIEFWESFSIVTFLWISIIIIIVVVVVVVVVVIIIIIIIIIPHELNLGRPVSASYNSLFKGLPFRLFPFGLYFSIIFGIRFIPVTLRNHFDLYLLVFLSIFPLTLALDLEGKPDIYISGTSQKSEVKNWTFSFLLHFVITLICIFSFSGQYSHWRWHWIWEENQTFPCLEQVRILKTVKTK